MTEEREEIDGEDEEFEELDDVHEDGESAVGEKFSFIAKQESAGERIDLHIAKGRRHISRSGIQRLIRDGAVRVNGEKVKPSYTLTPGDRVEAEFPPPQVRELKAEYLPLDIIYEDEKMLVVNKPPGIVVHPARGHWGGTLINAVLYHCHRLSNIAPGRPGIVHRLDRDTTGVILFMKEDWSHRHVARQFESRRVKKEYLAVVEGEMKYDTGRISLPLGRHPVDSRKMAVRMEGGRDAQTDYEVRERFRGYTLVAARPRTGRTHQIRVHFAASGHPVAADELYSKSAAVYLSDLEGAGGEHASDEEPVMARQALHAHRLEIEYPGRRERVTFEAPLPADMERFLEVLRRMRAP